MSASQHLAFWIDEIMVPLTVKGGDPGVEAAAAGGAETGPAPSRRDGDHPGFMQTNTERVALMLIALFAMD